MGSAAAGALAAVAAPATAGGFAIREQSTESQGASFAGDAAGPGLSAMFWNPAAATNKPGLNTESNYSLIIPRATIDVNSATSSLGGPSGALFNSKMNSFGSSSGEIASIAIVPASYVSYQLSYFDPNLFLGLAMNSPFGLVTEPENDNYKGAILARTSKLFTTNINPTLAYKVSPMLSLGVGLQAEYAHGTFKFATLFPGPVSGVPGAPAFTGQNTYFDGKDWAFGATAGAMFTPAPGTTIGIGWRSSLTHQLDGDFGTVLAPFNPLSSTVDLKLPDVVTLSLRQSIAPNMRLLGTVEWSNWSRFDELRVVASATGATVLGGKAAGSTVAVIPSNWSDGWFFSVGGEYDINRATTVRAGVAYEISPVDDPTKRIIGIPDSNRIWLSGGISYKWSEMLTFDFAYSHIFLRDADFNRSTIPSATGFFTETGTVKADTDIVSVSMKTKW